MKAQPYDKVRELIQDGDIISVLRKKKNPSFISSIISKVTCSPIYHTAIAISMYSDHGEKRVFALEAYDATRRMVPLSTYVENELHILAKPDFIDFANYSQWLIEKVGIAEYSYSRAIISGLRQYLSLPRINISTGEFCSELAAKFWKMGGVPLKETGLNPAELERILIQECNIQYRCWIEPK